MADFKHPLWLVGSSSKGSCKISLEVNKHPLMCFHSEEQPQNLSDKEEEGAPKGTAGNWQCRLVEMPCYISCTKVARGGMAHQNIAEGGDRLMWAEQKICINCSIAEGCQKAETTPRLARENLLRANLQRLGTFSGQ